jgi:cytoskeletal protein RodZ
MTESTAEAGPGQDTVGIGLALKTARREVGLTPLEVAAATRIRPAVLLRFEADDFSGCGGEVYVRGRLRKIAEAVDLDPEPLLAEYDARTAAQASGRRPAILARELQRRPRPPRNWSLVLAVALAVLLAYGVALLVAAVRG